jgi:hypothetical protein
MKNIFYFILACLIIFSTSTSCKKKEKAPCWTPDTAYTAFYPNEIGKIPYFGFDTLKFKNEATGIVHTFIGQGIDTSLSYYQRWFPDTCPEEFQKCQSKLYKFQSPTFSYPIFIRAYKPYGEGLGYLTIQFEGIEYFHALFSIGNGGYTDTINGHIYSKINDIRYEGDHINYNHIKYNVNEGILQVVYKSKVYSKQK